MLGRRGASRKVFVLNHLRVPSVRVRGVVDASGVPAPSLIWVHGPWSGDMMIDWVPDMCGLPKKVRPLVLSGASTQHRGGDRRHSGASRRHQ